MFSGQARGGRWTDGESGTCLELGLSSVDAICVLMEISGELHLRSGGVAW